jgi:RNase H-fold protein (predicted Holliday junction resolvase)
VHALDAGVAPVGVAVGRADEEDVAARGVGAVLRSIERRRDDVALVLDIFAPSRVIIPCVKSRANGSCTLEVAEVAQRLAEEPRVEQVQDRVLDAADVLVDRHPRVDGVAATTRPRRCGVAVAQEVPGRVDEGVHRVGLAPGAARRTRGHDVATQSSAAASGERPLGL